MKDIRFIPLILNSNDSQLFSNTQIKHVTVLDTDKALSAVGSGKGNTSKGGGAAAASYAATG